MSTVHSLPPEILSRIFVLCCQPDPSSGSLPPSNLSWTCALWRCWALATPALWTTIVLSAQEPISQGQINLLETWISRSGSLPLSIKINLKARGRTYGQHPTPTQVDWRLIQALLGCKKRWAILRFQGPQPFIHELVSPTSGSGPLLVELRVLTLGPTIGADIPIDITQFPKLSSLSLYGGWLPSLSVPQSVAASGNLKSLSLSRVLSETGLFILLSQLPFLESLAVKEWFTTWDFPSSVKPIEMTHLASLSLPWISFSVGFRRHLPDIILVPNLTHLTVQFDFNENSVAHNAILRFLRQSQPPLRSLAIRGEGVSEDHDSAVLLEIFSHTPGLRCLAVDDVGAIFHQAVMEALSIGRGNDLLPSLVKLNVGSGDPHFAVGSAELAGFKQALRFMFHSRSLRGDNPLTITFRNRPYVDPEELLLVLKGVER